MISALSLEQESSFQSGRLSLKHDSLGQRGGQGELTLEQPFKIFREVRPA